jgi:hypothetical protein
LCDFLRGTDIYDICSITQGNGDIEFVKDERVNLAYVLCLRYLRYGLRQ